MTRRFFMLALLAAAPPVLTGCNIIGGAAAMLQPPELVEAKYELPDKKTLVVIDDARPTPLVNDPAMLRRIASSVHTVLKAEQVVTSEFVGQDELAAYREELGEAYENTSLAALAIRLGAKQVIHAEVAGYQMAVGGSVYRPGIVLKVKVFDLDQRDRVFPGGDATTGEAIYPLQSRMPATDLSGQGGAARSIMARELAELAGRDLARLFFDWRRPGPGDSLDRQ